MGMNSINIIGPTMLVAIIAAVAGVILGAFRKNHMIYVTSMKVLFIVIGIYVILMIIFH